MKYPNRLPKWSVLCVSIFFGSILHAQFSETIGRLDRLNLLRANEQVYVQTDCEVYAPGDTLWFKAYVRNKASLQKSELSDVFSIFLADERGTIIGEGKHVIIDAQANGYLEIKKNINAGMYQILCYSSWMKNFVPDKVFKKNILILNESYKGVRFVPLYNKTGYLPGDTVRVLVKSYDAFNNPVDRSRFRYKFLLDEDVLQRGAGITSEEREYPITFVIPDSISDKQVLRIWDDRITVNFDIPVHSDIDVEFFPEGGNCLLGEINNLAFKAVYTNGQAVDIEGDILDQSGKRLSSIKTDHNGMGRFLYAPESSIHYLKITKPEGYDKLYALPQGQEDVWTIQTKTAKEQIFVKIGTNTQVYDTCLLTLAIRGYTYYYKLIPTEAKSSFKIPSAGFPAGIAVLTLLNNKNVPLAERLVFVNQDRFVNADMKSNKAKYLPRDLVSIDIDISNKDFDLEEGQYSLSVYDASFGSSKLIEDPNIISANYLSPEIKGQIVNPDYYFKSTSREIQYHLDLLLMTQGWRKYSYLERLHELDTMKLPESQDVIKGNIQRFKFAREPVPTSGEILVYFAGNSKKIQTDQMGNFKFIPEYSLDHTSQIIVSAKDNQESDKVYLSLNDNTYRDSLKNYLRKEAKSVQPNALAPISVFEDLNRNLDINRSNSIWIDEVSVNKKVEEEYEDPELGMIKSFSNVRSTNVDILESSMDMSGLLSNMGYYISDIEDSLKIYYRGKFESVKFIIDGIDLRLNYSDILMEYPPDVIENLYVSTGLEPSMVYGATVVIYIQTDIEKYRAKMFEKKIQNSKVIPGLQVVKEFYNPKYESPEEKKNPSPDLRKTIYWNPNVKIGENGNASVSFYNSDRYGKVKLVLEGMTDSGIPVYGESTYSIATYRE